MPSTQRPPHYGVLLAVLILLMIVGPVVPRGAEYVIELLFDLVLIAGVYAVAWQSKHRIPFLSLTVVTLVVRWSDLLLGHLAFSYASILLAILWLAYAVVLIVQELFRMKAVDTNAILAAIVAYFLSAVAFGSLFELMELVHPGSYSGLDASLGPGEISDALLYFSFVCMTTMGFGDIAPVAPLARSFAALEGVFGTLYLGVMIARLVGMAGTPTAAAPDAEGDP